MFLLFLSLEAIFSVYTPEYFTITDLPPAILHPRSLHNVQHQNPILSIESHREWGCERLKVGWLHSGMGNEIYTQHWKRFSWYDEVNYFIFMLFFFCLLYYCCLLPQPYARVGNVMMFCVLREGLYIVVKFIQFLLHQGSRMGWRMDENFRIYVYTFFFSLSGRSFSPENDGRVWVLWAFYTFPIPLVVTIKILLMGFRPHHSPTWQFFHHQRTERKQAEAWNIFHKSDNNFVATEHSPSLALANGWSK